MTYQSYRDIIKKYPEPEKVDCQSNIASLIRNHKIKIIILDDDPTGIQTVHSCLLLTSWKIDNLRMAFDDNVPFFYILTNSRSLDPQEAKKITKDIVQAIISINRNYRYKLIFISRSDSTLRGHFPLEPDTICRTILENNIRLNLPVFFVPALLEAGRYTIEDMHYMRDGDRLIPVAETEFAGDEVFGYKSSHLQDYIIEKSDNKINRKQIASITLPDIRKNPAEEIIEMIRTFKSTKYVIVNACDYSDLRKFALSFLRLFTRVDSFAVLRTSSSLPKALSGIEDKPLLTGKDIIKKRGPGILVVGSYVQKTTMQLKSFLKHPKVKSIEVDVHDIQTNPEKLLHNILQSVYEIQSKDMTPVVYTSRKELRAENRAEKLLIGKMISTFIVNFVKSIPYIPSYIVTKGGITSHDILKNGLNIKYARVKGQLIEGVPVIMTGDKNRFPNMPFIIFPGNVGTVYSLNEVFRKLDLANE